MALDTERQEQKYSGDVFTCYFMTMVNIFLHASYLPDVDSKLPPRTYEFYAQFL